MKRIIVLPAAEQDLQGIWLYSRDRWGEAQADRYTAKLSECFERIADGTAATRAAADIRPDMLRCLVGEHVVFFRHLAGVVEIVRVLHQSMDPVRWLH